MHTRSILIFVMALACVSFASPQTTSIAPVPSRFDLDATGIVERYGPPDFAVGNLIAYRGSFAELPADITFFLLDGVIHELTFAFPVEGKSAADLRRDADRVLKRLRTLYGPPLSVSRHPREFKVHLWGVPSGDMLHRVVYVDGRRRHELRTSCDRGDR